MIDYAISDVPAGEKTTVDGAELIPVVDLKESEEEDQNKYMTIDTLLSSVLTYESDILIYEDDILYMA